MNIPLRLFDCFGFATPACFFEVLAAGLVEAGFRFAVACWGGLADGITGDDRKADGDGMVIVVSIMAFPPVCTYLNRLKSKYLLCFSYPELVEVATTLLMCVSQRCRRSWPKLGFLWSPVRQTFEFG